MATSQEDTQRTFLDPTTRVITGTVTSVADMTSSGGKPYWRLRVLEYGNEYDTFLSDFNHTPEIDAIPIGEVRSFKAQVRPYRDVNRQGVTVVEGSFNNVTELLPEVDTSPSAAQSEQGINRGQPTAPPKKVLSPVEFQDKKQISIENLSCTDKAVALYRICLDHGIDFESLDAAKLDSILAVGAYIARAQADLRSIALSGGASND